MVLRVGPRTVDLQGRTDPLVPTLPPLATVHDGITDTDVRGLILAPSPPVSLRRIPRPPLRTPSSRSPPRVWYSSRTTFLGRSSASRWTST